MTRSLTLSLFLALVACGQARIIQITPMGGIIELQGDRSKAMEQATDDMNQKCGQNNFTIVQEGDETVGTETYVTENQQDQSHAVHPTAPAATDTTRPASAHRIHFQCNGTAGAPPATPNPY